MYHKYLKNIKMILTIFSCFLIFSCKTVELHIVIPRDYLNLTKHQKLNFIATLYEINNINYETFATNNSKYCRVKAIFVTGE